MKKKFNVPYNKKLLMTTAHSLYRDGRFGGWSDCVKAAWGNAKVVKKTLDGIGREAKTYGGWLRLGYEVVHHQHRVASCKIASARFKNQTTETLSFYTRSQVCVLGTQPPKV